MSDSVRMAIYFFVNFGIFKWLYLAYFWVYLHQTWGVCKAWSALGYFSALDRLNFYKAYDWALTFPSSRLTLESHARGVKGESASELAL